MIRSRILEFLCRPEARGTAVSLDSTNEDRQDLKSVMITVVAMTMMEMILMMTTSMPGRTSAWMTTTKAQAEVFIQFSVSQTPPSRGTKPGFNSCFILKHYERHNYRVNIVTQRYSSPQPSSSQRHLVPPSFRPPNCHSRYEQILAQRN